MASSSADRMTAVALAAGRLVVAVSLPRPTLLHPRDAIVRTIAAGICGSDLHVIHGLEGCDVGTILGHELVGVVVEAGSASTWLLNTVVVLPFTTACGACTMCDTDLSARCPAGRLMGSRDNSVGLHGTQAEFVRVPLADTTLVPLEPSLHPEEGLLIGDILSTAVFCALNAGVDLASCSSLANSEGGSGTVARLSRLLHDNTATTAIRADVKQVRRRVYVVVGCGPVGLLTILAAFELEALAAGRYASACAQPLPIVFAVDSVPARLSVAANAGATVLDIGALGEDGVVAAIVAASDDGAGADAVMECVGGAPPLAALHVSFRALRPGGTLASVGVPAPGTTFPFTPAQAYDKSAFGDERRLRILRDGVQAPDVQQFTNMPCTRPAPTRYVPLPVPSIRSDVQDRSLPRSLAHPPRFTVTSPKQVAKCSSTIVHDADAESHGSAFYACECPRSRHLPQIYA